MRLSKLDRARQVKHQIFLVKKALTMRTHRFRVRLRREFSKRIGYVYDENNYVTWAGVDGKVRLHDDSTFPVNHLLFSTAEESSVVRPVPRVLYLIWAGENAMTANRQRSFELVRRENSDICVRLVTWENLQEFILPDHPLHPAYPFLSAVHQSDYLRAYLMRHHGGAYLDLKPYTGRVSRWLNYFDTDPNVWAIGNPEALDAHNPARGGKLGRDQNLHVSRILDQTAFACRPNTPFVTEWLNEVERRMSYFQTLLSAHPAADPFGTSNDYPVPWFSLLSSVQSPLCLKYSTHIRVDPAVKRPARLPFADYR